MTRRALIIITLILFGVTAMPSFSQVTDGADALTRLFEEGPGALSSTSQFEAAVAQAQLEQILGQITGQLGAFTTVEGTRSPYTVVFEEGTATTHISLDGEGRVAGLQFTELIPTAGTLEQAIERVEQLQGERSLLIRRDGEVIQARRENEPMAVGSSFKLAVLAAVDHSVDGGSLSWGRAVELEESWKSLPSGILQDWPEGTSITIETLATLMISISDNTATDALISIVGREAVERHAPDSVPFLTTAEAFRLKNPANDHLLSEYRAGSTDERRAVLERLSGRPLPDASLFAGGPVAPDVEWFMSTTEVADLIERLEYLDLLTVNPGLARRSAWDRVAYKGGSEPGIMNLTTALTAADGTRYTVSLTVNREDAALDEPAIFAAYQAILQALRNDE